MSYEKKRIIFFGIMLTIIFSPLQSSNPLPKSGSIHFQDLLDEIEQQPRTSFARQQNSFYNPSLRRTNQTGLDFAIVIFGSSINFPTVTSWLSAITTLPKNREGADSARDSAFSSCGNQIEQWNEFKKILQSWLTMKANGSLSEQDNWTTTNSNNTIPNNRFFNIHLPIDKFQPFAQKIIVPENSVFYMRGDLHGDIFSLAAQLQHMLNEGIIDESFKIINPHHWMVFLGDYVDRGQYGCEVIYTILRLSLANPDRVIAVRGNHEETNLNIHYQFDKEVHNKFEDPLKIKFAQINRIYDFLPAVLYIGCEESQILTNYAQCCHGGIEIGYESEFFLDQKTKEYQLIDQLNTLTALQCLSCNIDQNTNLSKKDYSTELDAIIQPSITSSSIPIVSDQEPTHPQSLGFLWNDFDDTNTQQLAFNSTRRIGLIYGKEATIDALDLQSSVTSKIQWLFRGHQHSCDSHNTMMQGIIASNGIYKLWQPYETATRRSMQNGLVWTMNVGADSIYGEYLGFNFDTYITITTAKNPIDWDIQVFNQQIINPQPVILPRASSPIFDPNVDLDFTTTHLQLPLDPDEDYQSEDFIPLTNLKRQEFTLEELAELEPLPESD